MTKPKICNWCHNYRDHRCRRRNVPVGNTSTCSAWMPKIEFLGIPGIKFLEYEGSVVVKEK